MTTAHRAISASGVSKRATTSIIASVAGQCRAGKCPPPHHSKFPRWTIAGNPRCLSFSPSRPLTPISLAGRSRPIYSSIHADAQRPGRQQRLSSSPFSSSADTEGTEDDGGAVKVNKSIVMNPESYSRQILPGNYVMKKNQRTDVERKVFAERALGYFWMMKDLDVSNNKPILSNDAVVPPKQAELFPELKGLTALSGEEVDLPGFFVRNNRARDATARCTLVVLSFKDFGYKMLPSWTAPFESALCSSGNERRDRVEVVRISIQEGRILRMLKGLISSGFKKNIPEDQHESTLLYFGYTQGLKDALRMHNTLTGYCFLLDGIGRVRWAGSGTGTEEEVQDLIEFAKELTPASLVSSAQRQDRQRSRKGPTRPGKSKEG